MHYRHIFFSMLTLFNLSLAAEIVPLDQIRLNPTPFDQVSPDQSPLDQIVLDQSQELYIGPEIYHVHRTKAGGTKQNGTIYGIRAGYNRIKNNTFYLGAEGLYATGTLDGKSANGNKLKSHFTDRMIEGRLGYTLGTTCYGYPIQISPYGGMGHFEEGNDYKKPTPLHIHTLTKFNYVTGGFLSNIMCLNDWTFGLNFKLRYMWDPKSKVSHDPEFEDFTLLIKNRFHYRTEFPVTYHTNLLCYRIRLSLVPFFEYRAYGKHANYPYDYSHTKLQLYGATFKLAYWF